MNIEYKTVYRMMFQMCDQESRLHSRIFHNVFVTIVTYSKEEIELKSDQTFGKIITLAVFQNTIIFLVIHSNFNFRDPIVFVFQSIDWFKIKWSVVGV